MNGQLLLMPGPQPLALLTEGSARSERTPIVEDPRTPIVKPTVAWNFTGKHSLPQQAVDTLFGVLAGQEPLSKRMGLALGILHHEGFGLVILKHPAPGVVHAFNKRFGDRPLAQPEPADLGILYAAMARGE